MTKLRVGSLFSGLEQQGWEIGYFDVLPGGGPLPRWRASFSSAHDMVVLSESNFEELLMSCLTKMAEFRAVGA